MRGLMRLMSLVLALNVFVGVAHAHHSQAGIFDVGKTIEISGVVRSVSWRNPHGQILLSVKDERGTGTVSDAETASISQHTLHRTFCLRYYLGRLCRGTTQRRQ